jgi:4-amino-4-deoxy-L-arabinose transferase-like glycosyltransferase
VLATSLEFVALGRYGDLNMLLTFWLTAGVLAAHAWAERGGRGWGLGLAAAAAAGGTLTKGFVAPVLIGGTFVGYLALRGQLGLLRLRPILRAGALYLCVTLPWLVVAGVADPAYLRDFIVEHHIQRFLGGSRHLHPKPLLFTPLMTLVAFLPWSPLLPAVVRRGIAHRRARSAAADLCLAWAGCIVLFFTCSRGKLGTYVLPAMPPLALVTGRLLATLHEGSSEAADRRWVDRALVVAGVLFAAAAPAIVWVAAWEHGGAFAPFGWGALPLVPLGALVAWLAWRARTRTAAAVVALGTAVTVLGFYGAVAPALSDVVGDAVLARAIRTADPTRETPVIAYRTQNASLLFHLERPVPRLDRKRRLLARLAEAPKTFVVTRSVHLEGLPPDFTLLAGGTAGGHAVYVYERPG